MSQTLEFEENRINSILKQMIKVSFDLIFFLKIFIISILSDFNYRFNRLVYFKISYNSIINQPKPFN